MAELNEYVNRTDLKARIKSMGLSRRDVAIEMGLTPANFQAKLHGSSRFTPNERNWLETFLFGVKGPLKILDTVGVAQRPWNKPEAKEIA